MRKLSYLFALIAILVSCQPEKKTVSSPKDPTYEKAKSFLGKQNDSAYYYFNQVVTTAKDSSKTAYAYNYMSYIQSEAGDNFGAQESLTMSLRFLDTTKAANQKALASTFNVLGLTSINLKNYNAAVIFFAKAVSFSEPDQYRLVFLNNKALAYQKKGDYTQALTIYRTIIQQIKEPETYARVLSNMARTKWLHHPEYHAAPELLKALQLRIKINDQWGLNASYAHLADYYTPSHPDSVLIYASKMYAVARKLHSPDDELEALEKLIKTGPLQESKKYFTRYHQLTDSLQTARNASKNQFALIRYEVEKKEADNLKLQKDNTEKNTIIYSSIFLFIVVTIMLSYWYQKRRQQAVQENQLRLTTKVHNRLANGIYQLIQEIDNHEGYDREMVAQELTILYERSRDISHEPSHLAEIDFTDKIDRLLTAFSGPAINIAIVGNEIEYWENISDNLKSELEQVLQEWMVNMKKHSQATSVSVQFNRTEDQLKISYTDNGIGLSKEIDNGKGLQFAGNRIKMFGGSINFDTKWKKGIRIQLTLPLT